MNYVYEWISPVNSVTGKGKFVFTNFANTGLEEMSPLATKLNETFVLPSYSDFYMNKMMYHLENTNMKDLEHFATHIEKIHNFSDSTN
tara:strand:- start:4300 stop:4563 length:264 start_codon:yes stop_codon:yes gene_type:complete